MHLAPKPYRNPLILLLAALLLSSCSGEPTDGQAASTVADEHRMSASAALKTAIASPSRTEQERSRDRYRHPLETLTFFEIQPDQHVVELWPGGGWYTGILAPLLREQGALTAASFAPGGPAYRDRIHNEYLQRLADNREAYGAVTVVRFGDTGYFSLGPDNSADRVLTFRNTHNWIRDGVEADIYAAAYRVLKPGGLFGVVQHRAETGADPVQRANTGYVPQNYVIETAQAAGFEFVASSEINANPRDLKAYPEGVWTLPPSLRLNEKDRDKYLAIGESDRMTLKFRKPG